MKSIVYIPESCKEEFYTGIANALVSVEYLMEEFVEQNPDRSEWSDVDETMFGQLVQSQGTLGVLKQQIEKVS